MNIPDTVCIVCYRRCEEPGKLPAEKDEETMDHIVYGCVNEDGPRDALRIRLKVSRQSEGGS